MKNETMKNGTAIMGKDEWDQFDKTKVTFSFIKLEYGSKQISKRKFHLKFSPKSNKYLIIMRSL